jgi:ATP synthase protein I
MADHDDGSDADQGNGLRAAVDRRQQQRESWKHHGERPLWRNLSMVGALGWLIVTPTLLGVLAGRWLDARLGTGIFWSGALIMIGAGFGGYLAWKRIQTE